MAKAMGLARSGKVREAQSLIAGDRTIPDHPLALQALAALVTSEGDYVRALKLWELLLQRDPHHPEARRMIGAIELWLGRPPWMRYWVLGATTLCALLVAAAFWALASAPAAPVKPGPPSVVTTPVLAPEPQRRSEPLPASALNPGVAPAQSRTPAATSNPPMVTFPSSSSTTKKRNGSR